jgi:peptidoglycan/LPS O-acetylase OafA/YrhL
VFVLVYHAGLPFPGGFIGVDMFFVISGYVITGMLRREYEATGEIKFKEFYRARFLRLAPNLGLMVTTVLLAVAFVLPPLGWQQIAQKTGFASVFSVSNFVLPELSGGYFDISSSRNPFLHTWSLSIEEQFYLFFPILMLITLRSKNPKNWLKNRVSILVAMTLGSFILCLILSVNSYSSNWSQLNYYSMPTRFWEFACGSLLVFGKNLDHPRLFSWKKVIRAAAVTVIFCSGFLLSSSSDYPGVTTLFPVIATCILLSLTSQESYLNRFLSSRLLVAIGDMSYSLYLWHWPVIVLAMSIWPARHHLAIYATLISIVPAYLSYIFVEKKIRNKLPMDSRTFIKVFSAVLIVPSLFASSTWALASIYWKPKFSQIVADTQIFTSQNSFCHFDDKFESPQTCKYNVDGNETSVYLIGDSNAGHFGPGLQEATFLRDQPLFIVTSASCPFLPADLLINSHPQNWSCADYQKEILETLKNSRPGIVMLSFSEAYFMKSNYSLRDKFGNTYSSSGDKYDFLRESLPESLRLIKSFGHQILIIQPVPHFVDKYYWNLKECILPSLINGCKKVMPLKFTESYQGQFKQALSEVASTLNIQTHDFSRIICPQGSCATRDELGWVYADGTHITNSFSQRLKYELLDLIR